MSPPVPRAPTPSRPVDAATRRVVSRLGIAAVTSAFILVIVAAVFVGTRSGQRIDNAALSGRVVQHSRTAARSDRLLRTISVGSLALFGAALMAVALARGRGHLAIGVGAVIIGSNVTTEVFKWLIHRPPLTNDPHLVFNTLPSGHSTVAASLAAALVLVVPVRLRPLAATVGGLYAGGIAAMTLAAGWHRPSDAVSAFAVVGIWTFGVSAALVAARGTGTPRASEGLPGLVMGAVAVPGARVRRDHVVDDDRHCRQHPHRPHRARVHDGAAVDRRGRGAFMFSEVLLLRRVSLDRPSDPSATA